MQLGPSWSTHRQYRRSQREANTDEIHNTTNGRVDKEGQTTNNSRQRILRITDVKGLDQYQQHGEGIVDDEGASVLRVTVPNV